MKIPTLPDLDSTTKELLEQTERAVKKMGPDIDAINALLTSRKFLEESTRMTRALEKLQISPLAADIVKVGRDIEGALKFRDQIALTVGETLTASMSQLEAVAGPMLDAFSKILPAQDAAIRALNALAANWSQLQPIVTEIERAVHEAPDAPTRQRRLVEHLRALIEAVFGIDMELDSPHKRLALRYRLIVLCCLFILWVQDNQHESRQDTYIRHLGKGQLELRKARLEQAETIASLTTVVDELRYQVRELKSQLDETTNELVVLGRVTKRSILRAAPDGQAGRVTTVRSGQVLRIGIVIGRWYLAEVIDESHQRPAVKGWIYRRNVTILPFDSNAAGKAH
jgi:hypothetical protein